MDEWIRLVGPNQAVEIFGVKLVGVTAEDCGRLVFTILFPLLLRLMAGAAHRLAHRWSAGHRHSSPTTITGMAAPTGSNEATPPPAVE